MHSIDEILFSKERINSNSFLLSNCIDEINKVNVDVLNFSLKKDKHLKDGNVISSNDILIGVGVCDKSGMINVCNFDENNRKYFWVNLDEVEVKNSMTQQWSLDDVKIHYKAINEQWITKKTTKV